MTRVIVLAAVVVAGLAAGRGAFDGDGSRRGGVLHGRVVKVTDGDTIRVRLAGGRVERVRYIGIDTPEVFGGAECFGPEASAANARLVSGRDVVLTLDAEERDRYGRLLAYVSAGGVAVNERLVRDGFATVLTIAPNDTRAARFRAAADSAQARSRGLWGSC